MAKQITENGKVKEVLRQQAEKELFERTQLTLFDFMGQEHPVSANRIEGRAEVVSLFCGAGGLDMGFELAGLEAVLKQDLWNNFQQDFQWWQENREQSVFRGIYAIDECLEATETYKRYFPTGIVVEKMDIRKKASFPKCRVMLGGFPCPGFSLGGVRAIDDERNFLYIHFVRALKEAQPDVFVAENVKGILTHAKGEAFKQIVEDFANAGYRIYHKLVDAKEYGVPQTRERVFLVGIRNDIDWEYAFPAPTHGEKKGMLPYATLRDAIYDLRDRPGRYHEGGYSSQFMTRNRKKSWNEPAFTIQASGRQANIHPDGEPMVRVTAEEFHFKNGEENERRLSVRESARIQTFPDWMIFSSGRKAPQGSNTAVDKAYKQIGNAVPVLLARIIAKPIAEWLVNCQNVENNKGVKERAENGYSLHLA